MANVIIRDPNFWALAAQQAAQGGQLSTDQLRKAGVSETVARFAEKRRAEQSGLALANRARLNTIESKLDKVLMALAGQIEPQGPQWGPNAVDLFHGVRSNIDDGADLYRGGIITSDIETVQDDAAANTSFEITWSDQALARLRECRMWYMVIQAFPTSANGGAVGDIRQASKISVTMLKNGIPVAQCLNAPFGIVGNLTSGGAGFSGIRLNGLELVGTDSLTVELEVNATLTGTVGETSGVQASIYAGGTRDPWNGNYRGAPSAY